MEEMEGSIYYNLHYSSVSLIEHLNKDVALEVKRFRTLGCNALGEERGEYYFLTMCKQFRFTEINCSEKTNSDLFKQFL